MNLLRPGIVLLSLVQELVIPTIGKAGETAAIPPEFTRECGECTYKLTFGSPDSAGVYYELALPDPTDPDGRRRVYKGASPRAFITVLRHSSDRSDANRNVED